MPHMVPSISELEPCLWAEPGSPGIPPNFAGCLSVKKFSGDPLPLLGKPGNWKLPKLPKSMPKNLKLPGQHRTVLHPEAVQKISIVQKLSRGCHDI